MDQTVFYNKHYIIVDECGNIVDGWSSGLHPEQDTSKAICINKRGGYQFRLVPGGEENPELFSEEMIPLYRWDGAVVICRSAEEIETDRAVAHTLSPAERREDAYNTVKNILWEGEYITVTQAAQMWQYYAAEGSMKSYDLQALIATAKADIRAQCPDKEVSE